MVSIDKPKQASQTNPQYRHYSDLILKIERTYPTKQWGCPRVRIAILIRVPNPKTRSTQKKMQEPEVPAFYFICLGVPPPPDNRRGSMARWRVPDVIFFLYLSIVFYLGFPILPYALSFYWHFFLRSLHFIPHLPGEGC